MTTHRTFATAPDGTVLFMVGMRINALWAVHKWLPVTLAMPRMLLEQTRNRDLGMIGTPRSFWSGRIVMVVQYWRSYEQLESYAKAGEHSHLAAWRAFNRRTKGNRAVAVFHETYVIGQDAHESIYVNVPGSILLAAAVGSGDVHGGSESSRERLG